MKDNSDIDGGGTLETNRTLGRSQGSTSGKKASGNRSRSRRDQKDNRHEHTGDINGNASVITVSNAVATSGLQSSKVPRQATAEQIRIAQLLSNGEEEKALKIKVGQVVELTGCDQDTAALSLHDCDGDVTMSVHMILDARSNSIDTSGGHEEVKSDEWQTTSKRHPKKPTAPDSSNGQPHDSTAEKGDDWSTKNKDSNRDRRSVRRGASERRGGSRNRPGSGTADQSVEDGDRRRNRSERRGRGGGRGRGERAGRGRPTESVSPADGKEEPQFNGSSDADFDSFRHEGPDASREQTTMPPRFDGARRGGRGNSRGGGSGGRVFSSRGRGSRGRSRMSFGQARSDKASSAPNDGSMSNWTNEFADGSHTGHHHPPPNGDEGWDDMNEWETVWCGETQVFTNSKVVTDDGKTKGSEQASIPEDKSDKCATTLEDDDPAIVNSVSSAQLNEAAIAAFNHRATEVIKTSLGIGGVLGAADADPKPQRPPRHVGASDRSDSSSKQASSSQDKLRLRAALEEEILGGNGPKHARSKPPPPSKKPEQQVELPRLRGIPSDANITGFSFAFGSLDEIVPMERPNEKLEANLVSSPGPLSSSVDPCVGKPASETANLPETTIQEYLSSSLNSNSYQSSERQPTPGASTVSPVKPPSMSATPNQFHSPLKSVDTEDISVSGDPFQSSGGITADLSSELSSKLSTRTETQQTTQTQTTQEAAAVSLAEASRNDVVPSVPSVMDKATQPTPSSSQHNTPNKGTGVSRSQQTNAAPQTAAAAAAAAAAVAGGANLLNTLPAVSALLNYSHLATPGQHFPYINIPAMQQHGTIDYEQIVQQQQRIIYDLAQLQTQQQQQQQQQQHTSQTPPSQPTHHSQLQTQHQHETSTSMSVAVSSSSTNTVNASNVTSSVSGNGLKSISSNVRGSSVGDVSVQSPSALPGSALPHLQTVASSAVVSSSSGVASTAAPHNVFMPPGYPPFYHNYYPANPAAAAAAQAQAAPPGHHPNAAPAYNPAFLSLMNSMNQQPVSQALSSPPQFGSSIGVGKNQSSSNVFGSYSDRAYGASNTGGFDEHLSDMKYSGLNTGKDISNAYGGSSSGTGKPSSLGVGPGSSAYHSVGSSGSNHRGNTSMADSSSGTRNAGSSNVDGSSKSVSGGSGAVAPGAGASGFPFPLAGNPGLYNAAGYVPYMPHAHHHHLAAQSQQERQGTSSGVPQGTAAGSLPGGPQFGSKGNSGVFPKQATAILHQNYHPQTGASTPYWNNLK